MTNHLMLYTVRFEIMHMKMSTIIHRRVGLLFTAAIEGLHSSDQLVNYSGFVNIDIGLLIL